MDHCRLDFYCVGCHPEVFDPIKAMPALTPFTHTFTLSGLPDPALAGEADVIIADLRDADPGALQSLLKCKKASAQLIALADLERFNMAVNELAQLSDLWPMPMTEDELRFRFLRWQRTCKLSHDRAALAHELDAARADGRAKSAFLSSVSHDIRTPVNSIMGLVSLLRGDAGNRDRVLEYTRQIEAASHHLLSLINDVLDMNKLENGVATLNLGELCLADIIDEINAVIRPQTKARGQSFEIHASALTHEHLVGDKLRITQILINILSNAVKYTQKDGAISVAVTELPQAAPAGHSRVRFTITDNGQGMSEDYQRVIFHPFSREQGEPVNQIHGSGLGMAITRSLVDLMGGTIRVESRLGQGSTFTVELDLLIKEKEQDPNFWENHGIRRMIVADDDEYVCKAVVRAMAETGVEVEYATRGAAAAEMIRQAWEKGSPYDLLLLDWKMPELDGLATARLIREQKDSGKLPILLFTAYDWADIEKEALEAGISYFLPKPFFMSSFRDIIRRVMAGRGKPQAAPSSPDPKDVLRGKRVLVVDDIEVNRMILTKILATLGAQCDTAVNGQIAVEKFLSSAPGDIDLIMMDIQMPVMDGYTATRTIRASNHPLAQSIPVVAITANALVEDVREALKAGMDAHIAKPVVVDKLLASLRDVFAQREK